MAENSPLYPHIGRKAPAGGAHIDCGRANMFFVTVCTKECVPWMNQRIVENSLTGIWRQEATAWLAGCYLLMPDHMHFFCAPRTLHFGIDQWITCWKSVFSRQHLDRDWQFQRRSFHHRMRNASEFSEKWTYVRENPFRKGLVKKPGDWPFQGQVNELWWSGP